MTEPTKTQDYANAIVAMTKPYDEVIEEDRVAVASFLADINGAHRLIHRQMWDSLGMDSVIRNDGLARNIRINYQAIIVFLQSFTEGGDDGSENIRLMAIHLIRRFSSTKEHLEKMHRVTESASRSYRSLHLPRHPHG